jgi:hypothetical protein
MRHALKPLLRTGPGLGAQASGAARAGAELALFAAVAAGCAQAGLVLLSPGQAQAGASARDGGFAGDPVVSAAPAETPFDPGQGLAEQPAAAALHGIQLTGLRVGAGSVLGGAILTLPTGGQEAFLVGQEVSPGLTLTAVTSEGATFSFAGGDQTLGLAQVTGQSYARALMGLGQASADSAVGASAYPVLISAVEQEWIAATLASPVQVDGTIIGYRLADRAPDGATAAGLRPGDVVEAINGVSAGDPLGLIAAIQTSGALDLMVRRQDGVIVQVRFAAPDLASPLERTAP